MNRSILSACGSTIRHLRGILETSKERYIFVGVEGGGCNGLKYCVSPSSETPDNRDESVTIGGVPFVVCGRSLLHIIGSRMEWKSSAMGSGITFVNPNAK